MGNQKFQVKEQVYGKTVITRDPVSREQASVVLHSGLTDGQITKAINKGVDISHFEELGDRVKLTDIKNRLSSKVGKLTKSKFKKVTLKKIRDTGISVTSKADTSLLKLGVKAVVGAKKLNALKFTDSDINKLAEEMPKYFTVGMTNDEVVKLLK